MQAFAIRRRHPRQQLDDPALMLGRHGVERALPLGSQSHRVSAAIAGNSVPLDQSFGHELIGQACHVASGHHQPPRQLAHLEPFRRARELCHEVEPRQRHPELPVQSGANAPLDQRRAGQQTQPQLERSMICVVEPRFGIAAR